MDTSLISMIGQATLGAQVLLVLLLLLSVVSWGLIFMKWRLLKTAKKKVESGLNKFQKARDLREAVSSLSGDVNSPLYYVAEHGVSEFNRVREMQNTDDVVVDNVRRALTQGVGEEMVRLSQGLSFLATTGNTAPFIGLLGTVYGIMHAFHNIGLQKSASLASVAPGISEALVATAVGLFVAIPATVAFNSFNSRLSDIEVHLTNFGSAFLNRVQREINAPKNTTTAAGTK
ncbi:MAG: protein TolQ [Desulfovibrionaceae bacterium]|nr:protein TolQ [Desulfovibrionaceae bacterium]